MIPVRARAGGLGADDYGGTTGYDWDYSTPAVTTPTGTPVSSTAGINWNALISQGFSLTKQIIQTQPGVYTQQGPNGTLTYRQPLANTSNLPIIAGGTLPTSVGAALTGSLTSSSLGIIALGGAALLLVLMMGRR